MLPDLPVRRATALDEVRADLSTAGLALIDIIPDPARLIALTRALGATVVPHRDSGPDGVTVIEDRGARAAAFAGFTQSALTPHTDRSGTADPPNLLLTVCAREPTSGGESILVDGRAVYLHLAYTAPDALKAFSAPRSALFGGADGYLGSVFTLENDDIVSVRLRLDALARFSPTAAPHLPTLRGAIERHAIVVPTRAGIGYVLDNHRWLHGRRRYTGPRRLYRVTAYAQPGSIASGFTNRERNAVQNSRAVVAGHPS